MERIAFWGWPLHGAIDTLPHQICRPLALTRERHGEVANNEAICAHQPLSDDCGAHDMSIKGGALSSHINARPVHFVGSVPLAGAGEGNAPYKVNWPRIYVRAQRAPFYTHVVRSAV